MAVCIESEIWESWICTHSKIWFLQLQRSRRSWWNRFFSGSQKICGFSFLKSACEAPFRFEFVISSIKSTNAEMIFLPFGHLKIYSLGHFTKIFFRHSICFSFCCTGTSLFRWNALIKTWFASWKLCWTLAKIKFRTGYVLFLLWCGKTIISKNRNVREITRVLNWKCSLI